MFDIALKLAALKLQNVGDYQTTLIFYRNFYKYYARKQKYQ
jgi:hypothetical protein